MNERIILSVPVKRDEQQLLRMLRMKADREDENYQCVANLLDEAERVVRPKYAFSVASVDKMDDQSVVIDGYRIESALVRKNLDQTHRVVLYIATCGQEIESWSTQISDPVERFWADEIKKHFLSQCALIMRNHIKDTYFQKTDLSHMSPGSLPEWPLTQQKILFSLMRSAADQIGVTLTESCLMLPSKSISGFYFSSAVHFENCKLCPMPNCPSRRAVYTADDLH